MTVCICERERERERIYADHLRLKYAPTTLGKSSALERKHKVGDRRRRKDREAWDFTGDEQGDNGVSSALGRNLTTQACIGGRSLGEK